MAYQPKSQAGNGIFDLDNHMLDLSPWFLKSSRRKISNINDSNLINKTNIFSVPFPMFSGKIAKPSVTRNFHTAVNCLLKFGNDFRSNVLCFSKHRKKFLRVHTNMNELRPLQAIPYFFSPLLYGSNRGFISGRLFLRGAQPYHRC